MTKTNDKELIPIIEQPIRLDRNILNNFDLFDFLDYYDDTAISVGKQSTLARHVVTYVMLKWMKSPNLFDEFVFDIDEFAQLTNYGKTHLQTEHPKPYTTIVPWVKTADKGNWNSVIENVLYALVCPAPYAEDYCTINPATGKKEYVSQITNWSIFKTLKKVKRPHEKGAGRPKVAYQFVLSDEIKQNLVNYYTLINYQSFTKLKSAKADELYMFLKSKEQELFSSEQNSTDQISFDRLCAVAGIKNSNPSRAKINLTTKINKVSELSDCKVAVDYVKNVQGSKHKFRPVLKFLSDKYDSIDNTELLYNHFVKELLNLIPNEMHSVDKMPLGEDNIDVFVMSVVNKKNMNKTFKFISNDKETSIYLSDIIKQSYINAQLKTYSKISAATRAKSSHIALKLSEVKTIEALKTELASSKI